ncbi:hypothetical protein I352_03270 [Cryptococcus deuterogattii MMRL2647]|nr:hypothetical protein I352_03270 [Cryptococcus deuterogattii MMRL2647]
MSSQVLGRDIEEIREKVERMKEKKNNESEGVKLARQSVEQCYLYVALALVFAANEDKPLDCWKQVEAFKTEVAKLEQAFVKSLQ